MDVGGSRPCRPVAKGNEVTEFHDNKALVGNPQSFRIQTLLRPMTNGTVTDDYAGSLGEVQKFLAPGICIGINNQALLPRVSYLKGEAHVLKHHATPPRLPSPRWLHPDDLGAEVGQNPPHCLQRSVNNIDDPDAG